MSAQLKTVVPVWLVALVGAIGVAILVPASDHLELLPIVMVAAILVTFGIQLAVARKEGFVTRIVVSLVGAIVILAGATLVLGLLPVA